MDRSKAAIAAAVLVAVMLGAVTARVTKLGTSQAMPLALLAGMGLVLWGRRDIER